MKRVKHRDIILDTFDEKEDIMKLNKEINYLQIEEDKAEHDDSKVISNQDNDFLDNDIIKKYMGDKDEQNPSSDGDRDQGSNDLDKANSDIGSVGKSKNDSNDHDKKILDKIMEYDCREYKPRTDVNSKTLFDNKSPRGIHDKSIPPQDGNENLKDFIAESQNVLDLLADSTEKKEEK